MISLFNLFELSDTFRNNLWGIATKKSQEAREAFLKGDTTSANKAVNYKLRAQALADTVGKPKAFQDYKKFVKPKLQ